MRIPRLQFDVTKLRAGIPQATGPGRLDPGLHEPTNGQVVQACPDQVATDLHGDVLSFGVDRQAVNSDPFRLQVDNRLRAVRFQDRSIGRVGCDNPDVLGKQRAQSRVVNDDSLGIRTGGNLDRPCVGCRGRLEVLPQVVERRPDRREVSIRTDSHFGPEVFWRPRGCDSSRIVRDRRDRLVWGVIRVRIGRTVDGTPDAERNQNHEQTAAGDNQGLAVAADRAGWLTDGNRLDNCGVGRFGDRRFHLSRASCRAALA